jgi:Ca-activated chloride channel family protein
MHRVHTSPIVRLAAAAVLVCIGLTAAHARQAGAPNFRSSIDLVMLHVSVTDRSGQYVADLEPSELTVFENGRPQELRLFERGGLPLSVMLLLDVSSSMYPIFPTVQQAARQFLAGLTPQDEASVVAFADGVQILQPFTSDQQALAAAIGRAKPRGNTRLFTALYISLKELNRPRRDEQSIPRRRVAVLLSDGDDTASLLRFEDVIDLARRSDMAIYAIRLAGPARIKHDTGESEFVLRRLTTQTGGRAFLSVESKDLGPVYENIRLELSRQYALGYVSNDVRRDGKFRHLSVQVSRPETRARSRVGYFAPPGGLRSARDARN